MYVCVRVHVCTCMAIWVTQVSTTGKEVNLPIQSGPYPGFMQAVGWGGGSLLDSGDSSRGDGVCFGKG